MHALVLVLGRVFWAVQAQPREVGGDVGCRAAQWQKLSPDRELYQQHYFEPERGELNVVAMKIEDGSLCA
jgi:hypothetical protein